MLCYCKKCGRLVLRLTKELEKPCDYCHSHIYPVPDEYLGGKSKSYIKIDLEQQFIDEYIKLSPEFDQYLFDHRDHDLAQQTAELEAKLAHGKAVLEGRDKGNKFGVECPYCHATNVKKISTASKVAHTAVFGVFSMGRNAKNYHCNHCNSDF